MIIKTYSAVNHQQYRELSRYRIYEQEKARQEATHIHQSEQEKAPRIHRSKLEKAPQGVMHIQRNMKGID